MVHVLDSSSVRVISECIWIGFFPSFLLTYSTHSSPIFLCSSSSLADVTCFGCAPTLAILSYFESDPFTAFPLALLHFTCTVCRLAKFMTVDGPPGLFSGMPCPFAGVFVVAVIAGQLPPNLIIIGTIIHAYYMISFGTCYVKPFSVKSFPFFSLLFFPVIFMLSEVHAHLCLVPPLPCSLLRLHIPSI